jgi:opacity protein-like surface antigen
MRLRHILSLAVLLAPSILLPAAARGADGRPAEPDPAAAFPRGLWTLELSASYADPIRFSEDELGVGTVGVNYYLYDNLSLGLHLSGYGVDQPAGNDDGYGVGFEGWLRWHLLTLDRFTLYADGGGGRAYFEPETPEGGTNWNWTAKVGGGVTYRLDDNVYLMGGARYFHISNGNQFGRPNNPSFDSVQYYVGVMFTF